ncbi:hypothetical protein HCJ33_10220 [Listeria seeligeri]|uniref:hypothetical protein n=1 Tax=Listeria seeligeri TaxID=1640 RepID=UPI001625822E|nr:hypothetical protein [Listeria seeligeri]MBC1990342.1 hypothetical protein [Listeria seeligeri]
MKISIDNEQIFIDNFKKERGIYPDIEKVISILYEDKDTYGKEDGELIAMVELVPKTGKALLFKFKIIENESCISFQYQETEIMRLKK